MYSYGSTPVPLMIDFTTRNQTLCDFIHRDTPCLTPSVYAALPVPCLSADEVTVDYTANLKERLMKSISLLPWKPDSLPLDSPLWEEMSDFSLPVSSFTTIWLGCCDWWIMCFCVLYIFLCVVLWTYVYFVSLRDYGCGHT